MQTAFLGLGRMGAAMAGHVLDAGHDLVVWNRSPGRAEALTARGAVDAGSVREAVAAADVVVLMLFGPDAVREVLPEVVAAARPGTLVVDSTTIGPAAAREFGRTASEGGLRYVDAPVAGSVAPATAGTLGVLVGGAQADYDEALPLLQTWGDPAKVRRVGEVGAGSALKLVVNQGIGVLATGLGEALALAGQLGLDRGDVLDLLSGSAYGWVLGQKRPAVEADDYTGTQFSLELLAKDMELAVGSAGDAELAVTRAALADLRSALDAGHAGEDYAAVIGHLADEGRADSY
jgi:3-hydroxyisobutyrate dehydrogenase